MKYINTTIPTSILTISFFVLLCLTVPLAAVEHPGGHSQPFLQESIFENMGPHSASVRGFVEHERKVYALSEEGVYESANARTWRLVLPGAALAAVEGPRGLLHVGLRNGGVWRLDEGQWRASLEGVTVLALASGDDALFAGTPHGLLRRAEGDWSSTELTGRSVTALLAGGGLLLAGSGGTIYRSRDGVAWEAVAEAGGLVTALAFDDTTRYLYAGTSRGTLLRSIDGGTAWEPLASPSREPISAITIQIDFYLATLGDGLHATYDDGESWERMESRLDDQRLQAIFMWDNTLLAGTRTGIDSFLFTWERASDGLGPASIATLKSDTEGNLYAVSFQAGLFSRRAYRQSWQRVSRGLPSGLRDVALGHAGSPSFAASDRGLHRRAAAEDVWQRLATPLELRPANAVAVNHETGRVYAASATGVWSSADRGESWQRRLDAPFVVALEASPRAVFAATRGSGVLVSYDGGESWVVAAEQLKAFSRSAVVALARGEMDSGEVVLAATRRGGVFVSRNGGESWRGLGGLPKVAITAATVGGEVLFVAARSGEIFRFAEGEGWQRLKQAPEGIGSLTFADGRLFAGLVEGGVVEVVLE